MATPTKDRYGRLVVTSATLDADDNDWNTRRYFRPSNGGTGQRSKPVALDVIRVPNHPDSVRWFGTHSSLAWCAACDGYTEHAHGKCHCEIPMRDGGEPE
jgi:hypothetical protein